MGVRSAGSLAEVLLRLSILSASQQQSVLAGRVLQGKLVEGHDPSAGLGDSGSGRVSNSEGAHIDLGKVEKPVVVSHGTHNHGHLVGALEQGCESGDGHRSLLNIAMQQSLVDGLAEIRVRSSGQELVESDQNVEVQVRGLSRRLLDIGVSAASLQINTLERLETEFRHRARSKRNRDLPY